MTSRGRKVHVWNWRGKLAAVSMAAWFTALGPVAHAQTSVISSGGETFTGGTLTSPLLLPAGTVSAPPLAFSADTNTGLFREASAINAVIDGERAVTLFDVTGTGVSGVTVQSDGGVGFSASATTSNGAADVVLRRDATDKLALRRSTNAQAFLVYGTFTDASNYVRAAINTTSTTVALAAETAGTGADNIDVAITPAGTGNVTTAGGFTSSNAGSLGWSVVAGANTACTTTCTSAAVLGFDTAVAATPVGPADATADICLCAGAS